jgi:hypothetical protein
MLNNSKLALEAEHAYGIGLYDSLGKSKSSHPGNTKSRIPHLALPYADI